MITFHLAVQFHDDGIPDELNAAQCEQAMALTSELVGQMTCLATEMDRFTDNPSQEIEMTIHLVATINDFRAVGKKIMNDPIMYSHGPFPGDPLKPLREAEQKLEASTENLVTELQRRRESNEFKCNQECYDQIREAFQDYPEQTSESFCNPDKCLWCCLLYTSPSPRDRG